MADDRQARPRGANDAIRVLIVDDHALFRRGLEMVLEQEDDVEVVGEAGGGGGAITKTPGLIPDGGRSEVRLPRPSGTQANPNTKHPNPPAQTLMLTTFH